MRKSGIYTIRNDVNDKLYVGSATDLVNRRSHHFHYLRNNIHFNSHLQRAYNKYGHRAFSWHIEEYVSNVNNLIAREQYHIDKYNYDTQLYNICRFAGNTLGRTTLQETKNKIGSKLSRTTLQLCQNTGEILAIYASVKHAEIITGLTNIAKTSRIHSLTQSAKTSTRSRTNGGYLWCYDDLYNDHVITSFIEENKHRQTNKPVIAFSIDTYMVVNTYVSLSEAARNVSNVRPIGGTATLISRVCRRFKSRHTAYGYIWRYSNDMNDIIKLRNELQQEA